MTQPITLITGTSKGIGKATADRLTADGHLVIGIARTVPNEAPGPFYAVDLTDREATAQALDEITQKYEIDNLVNNVGGGAADSNTHLPPLMCGRSIETVIEMHRPWIRRSESLSHQSHREDSFVEDLQPTRRRASDCCS